MKRTGTIGAAAAFLVLGLSTGAAKADDLKTTARAVAAKTQKAIVTVKLVLKISIGEREQDQTVEVTGTVIDPSGLTVISAASLDPAAGFRGMMGGRRGGGGGGEMPQIETEVTGTSIHLDDDTEVEADVVLKDAELDLAFIRPRETTNKFEHVELKAHDAAPQPLDEVFVVGRLGRAANRAVSLSVGTVKAIVKGPRTFYVCDGDAAAGNTGCIAYAADGSPLGVFVTRTQRGEGGGMGMRGRGMMDGGAIVLRPINDVIELAKQAKEKKSEKKSDEKKPAPEKKPEEKKPTEKKKGDDF